MIWPGLDPYGSMLDFVFCSNMLLTQELEYIEYFAGHGNLTKQMRAAKYRSARLDIKDHTPKNTKSNYMDLNTASGYAFLWLNVRLQFKPFSLSEDLKNVFGMLLKKCHPQNHFLVFFQ